MLRDRSKLHKMDMAWGIAKQAINSESLDVDMGYHIEDMICDLGQDIF